MRFNFSALLTTPCTPAELSAAGAAENDVPSPLAPIGKSEKIFEDRRCPTIKFSGASATRSSCSTPGALPRPWPLAEAALAAHEASSGPDHPWTKDSARVTADALAALGRAEEAAALRPRHGLAADSG